MRYLEDFRPGTVVELGAWTFTAEEIVAFARDYDPQPFHLDAAAGEASLFGGLAASGWHVACAWMRLWIDLQARETERALARGEEPPVPGPSPGFDDMRWTKPVLAGRTITYRSTLTGGRTTRSRPGWGILDSLNEGFDETGARVFHFTGHVMWPCRPPTATEPGADPDHPA
ncbi:MAG: MaoC family dehydratase [Siculibacillus sp.]|nr:MaoC family dehydratase [Siculibacillus sp.]